MNESMYDSSWKSGGFPAIARHVIVDPGGYFTPVAGKSPFSLGNTSSTGPFSFAM